MFVEKLMALFFHSVASLVNAECACAGLIFTSFIDVPYLVCVNPRYLNCQFLTAFSQLSLCWWSWLNADDGNFAFIGSWIPCRIQQQFSPVFQWVAGVLRCLPADRCRQQTTSCRTVVLRRTLTRAGCQFLLHLLMHHLQSSHSTMDAEVSKLSALSFPWRY